MGLGVDSGLILVLFTSCDVFYGVTIAKNCIWEDIYVDVTAILSIFFGTSS